MSKKSNSDNTESTRELRELDAKVRRHLIKKNIIRTVTVTLAVAFVIYIIWHVITKKYEDYSVLSTVDKEVGDNTVTASYKDGFIKYDNDGITCYDSMNKVLWQQSYEFRNPIASVCGSYVAVSGLEKSEVIVFSEKGKLVTIDTLLPIMEVDVTDVGAVVVTLYDGETSYIRMYDSMANIIYELKKVTWGDGYPVAVAVSDDGKRLALSMSYVGKGVLKHKLMFYNFSKVGQNEVDNFVGEFESEDIMTEIRFLPKNRFLAISSKNMQVYTYEEYPKLSKNAKFGYEPKSVFVTDDRIATLHDGTKGQELDVYDMNCKKLLNKKLDRTYENLALSDKGVMLYNSDHACLINKSGRVKFEYDFDIPVNSILWMPGKNRFAFVNVRSIQQVILK